MIMSRPTRVPTEKGRNGMYSNTLIGLLAIAMTASAFGGTMSLFEVNGSQVQEQAVA